MINPNLALAAVTVTFPADEDFDPKTDINFSYSDSELEKLEVYGVVANAVVFLKIADNHYSSITLGSSVWGVTVFSDDRSYLQESAGEVVAELQYQLKTLGVELAPGKLPYTIGEQKLLTPKEAFAKNEPATKFVTVSYPIEYEKSNSNLCPICGEEAHGTVESFGWSVAYGTVSEDGETVEHSGETEADFVWNSQETVYDNGQTLFACPEGHAFIIVPDTLPEGGK